MSDLMTECMYRDRAEKKEKKYTREEVFNIALKCSQHSYLNGCSNLPEKINEIIDICQSPKNA